MKKNVMKIGSLVLTVGMLLAMSTAAFAGSLTTSELPTPGDVSGGEGLGNIASTVLGGIQFVGYAFAIGMLIYIGIKYMMSSANEKADLKKGSINYVIGAILVAAASTIVGIFKSIGSGISG